MASDDLLLCEEDGFFMPDVGRWATTKHRKVGYYSSIFSRSMKSKWDCRVYIDLFAGAGKSRLQETGEIVPGSPLRALGVSDPFDKYVFCERVDANYAALRERVTRYFPERNVSLVHGDCNAMVDQVLAAVPKFSAVFKGLTLCFVDPFKMGELRFDTVRKLADQLYADFLVLIPSYMDIKRNERVYTGDDCLALDDYLGTSRWRAAWRDPERRIKTFGVFVADFFGRQMAELGCIYEGTQDLELVRTLDGKNLPLYHLAFFSRHELGLRFWRQVRKHADQQPGLW